MNTIAVRTGKVVYVNDGTLIKVFDEKNWSKSEILNEALNQARIEETGLNIPKIREVGTVDGKWALMMEYIEGVSLADLLRRPNISYEEISEIDECRPILPRSITSTASTNIKYEGYVKKQLSEVKRQEKLEAKQLSPEIDYLSIKGLRIEAAQKLAKTKPMTVGQASRISGVSPADISVLLVYLGIK